MRLLGLGLLSSLLQFLLHFFSVNILGNLFLKLFNFYNFIFKMSESVLVSKGSTNRIERLDIGFNILSSFHIFSSIDKSFLAGNNFR